MARRVSLKGKGAELFFAGLQPDDPGAKPKAGERVAEAEAADVAEVPAIGSENRRPNRRGGEPRRTPPDHATGKRASSRASNQASDQASEATVEAVRKVVKALGKEVTYVRLTPAEKGELAEVVFAFKQRGVKTTENEISRIALNALLADHQANGDASLLARVLAALRA